MYTFVSCSWMLFGVMFGYVVMSLVLVALAPTGTLPSSDLLIAKSAFETILTMNSVYVPLVVLSVFEMHIATRMDVSC